MNASFKLDMTMMYAFHDALRRDLKSVAHLRGLSEGWDMFKRYLHAHHVAEDEALWPIVREAVAGRAEDLALLDELEAEHAALGPLLGAIDEALVRGEPSALARAELVAALRQHLAHEEDAGLPVIDRTLSEDQWMQFGEAAASRIGPDMSQFLPWLLDGADPERTTAILGHLPDPAQHAYKKQWRPAYRAKHWWAS